jgi:hypothetical protein
MRYELVKRYMENKLNSDFEYVIEIAGNIWPCMAIRRHSPADRETDEQFEARAIILFDEYTREQKIISKRFPQVIKTAEL